MKFSKPMSHRLVPVLSEYSENTPCCSREKSELFPTPTRPANTILYSGMLKNEIGSGAWENQQGARCTSVGVAQNSNVECVAVKG